MQVSSAVSYIVRNAVASPVSPNMLCPAARYLVFCSVFFPNPHQILKALILVSKLPFQGYERISLFLTDTVPSELEVFMLIVLRIQGSFPCILIHRSQVYSRLASLTFDCPVSFCRCRCESKLLVTALLTDFLGVTDTDIGSSPEYVTFERLFN